jgi:hypothetical protein
MIKRFKHIVCLAFVGILVGCATTPPSHLDDVCSIFHENPKWYWSAKDAAERWGVPIPVQMAIVHQESHFHADARPPRRWILGVIPWFRPSSAYGYAQILDSTWEDYQDQAGVGGSRNRFTDITDFIGWYADVAYRRASVPRDDAYKLYLAYHEGAGGYARQTYDKKPWLTKVAGKVAAQSARYRQQLAGCAQDIPSKHWWQFG